jgi:hypothetical protein
MPTAQDLSRPPHKLRGEIVSEVIGRWGRSQGPPSPSGGQSKEYKAELTGSRSSPERVSGFDIEEFWRKVVERAPKVIID